MCTFKNKIVTAVDLPEKLYSRLVIHYKTDRMTAIRVNPWRAAAHPSLKSTI